jgi:hypothetical protein
MKVRVRDKYDVPELSTDLGNAYEIYEIPDDLVERYNKVQADFTAALNDLWDVIGDDTNLVYRYESPPRPYDPNDMTTMRVSHVAPPNEDQPITL